MLKSAIDLASSASEGFLKLRAHGQTFLTDVTRLLRKPWQTFVKDVIARPSVGPGAGWLVGGLIGLVVWLTVQYAPGAVATGTNAEQNIPVSAGYWTIGLVSVAALAVGWEPIISRWLGDGWSGRRRAWLSRQNAWLRMPLLAIGGTLWTIYLVPSLVLSFIDWFLVRIAAVLAGTTLRPILLRYAVIFAWVLGGTLAGSQLPAPYGLIGVAVGILAIAAVVRRWSWIERDREAFLAARGSDPDIERIGFAEDLRDEALTAIVFLFVLIPLGLHQINLAYEAFQLEDAAGNVISGEPTLLGWMGFFGAELAKAVPFVDWSEVFKVANGSPIKPKTTLGAQFVFALRASLDLLLLAAVLQAWQIAARLRDQTTAFWAKRLPILDPFAERATFRPVALGLFQHPHVKPTEQPPVREFPIYERRRLVEIAKGAQFGQRAASTVLLDPVARRGALAVLVRQHRDRKTSVILRDLITHDQDGELRRFALRLASEPPHVEIALHAVLHDRSAPVTFREIAARELGRVGHRDADGALALLADNGEALAVRAQAGLWLAKIGDGRAEELVLRLASAFAPDTRSAELTPVMSTAYACAFFATEPHNAQAVADTFPTPLRPHALRAIRSALGELDQMTRIPGGKFTMGSPESEEGRRSDDEGPQHAVTIAQDFDLGKYPVTFEEYDAFCAATGRDLPDDQKWGRDRRPVINVLWDDANAYCDWLNSITGERYRLPSEAEWEYACRAGTQTPFSFGDTISTGQANYNGDYTYGSGVKGEFREQTTPVDTFPAHAFGLHDMHGNVWEWCGDQWHDTYACAPADGSVWTAGGSGLRVLRGGSWLNVPRDLRAASRLRSLLSFRFNFVGFRLARTLSL